MTQQTTLLRKLWQEQTAQGYRFRATVKADRYNWDEARAFWMIVNPTLIRERTVLASHMWVQQDQSLAYPPPVGAIISFDAEVTPYRRKNGTFGFGLHHLCNVRIEAEVDAELTDYAMNAEEVYDELELTDELAEVATTTWSSGGVEQNIAAAAQRRTERLTQHIQFNARIAALAQRQEEVTTQFLQAWQQAQAVAADMAKLTAEIDGDPNLAEERAALQQLADLQRDLAAAYWHWQPTQPPEDTPPTDFGVTEPPFTPSAATITTTMPSAATELPAPLLPPIPAATSPAAATVLAPPIAVVDEPAVDLPEIDLMTMIRSALPTHDTSASPPPALRKAPKRQVAPPPRDAGEAADVLAAVAAPPTTSATPPQAAHSLPPPSTAPTVAAPPATKRARDQRALHDAIVEQVWKLVQRLQPLAVHVAPYTLAQIKDGRIRETDHLKLIGLKAILAALAVVDERPTRKELARYLGYDLPKAWSLSKLSAERLPQEDEKVQVEVVREVKKFIHTLA